MHSTPRRQKANAENPQSGKVSATVDAIGDPWMAAADASFDDFTKDLRRLYHSRYGGLTVYVLKTFIRKLDAQVEMGGVQNGQV